MINRIISAAIGKNSASVTTSANNEELFWLIGDSWVQGSNNTTGPGPDATGKGYYFRTSDNTIQPITTTDIPGAVDGSPWPQFCIDYFNSTGTKAVVIPNGIGGTKFFDTWNGFSATYTTAKQDAIDAMAVAGVTRLKWILISCGINDARSGDDINTINQRIGNLFYQLNVDFPNTNIGVVLLGTATTGGSRIPQVRGFVKEQANNYTKVHILCQAAPLEPWGFYGADGIHLTQTGNNQLGTMINRYIQLPTTYSKWTRTIANSYYSVLSSQRMNAIENWLATMGSQYFDLVGYFKMKVPVKNDVYVDWALLTIPTDDGFDFTANSFITTDTNKSIRMNISPNSVIYRYTASDFGVGAATYDRKGAFGTSTKYLVGASSGSNVLGLAETSTGVMQYFAYDNGTASTGTGGFADNTEYGVMRVGTLKSRVVNGVVTHTESIAAGAALTSGLEVGARYTAGPTLFLNTEIAYFWWHKASTWNTATFYSANQTLESQW